jgi:crotonobetainyl-CoA:carnitine CoA-transferase CaiB-like acyl-CoA transferase
MRGDASAAQGVEIDRRDAWLGGPLPVDDLAVGAIGTALLAAAELVEARGARRPVIGLSAEHVALSVTSERHALRGAAPAGGGFAPMSRLVRCLHGGWARTHANYPHHARALARALELHSANEHEMLAELEATAGSMEASALEDAVFAAGGCAATLRSADEWRRHPAGSAAARAPLVDWDDRLATRFARPLRGETSASAPAAGARVLDLTRVIAGPVAGRTLAAFGAEVLRVDPPKLPELPQQHLDTGPGKRTAVLDLADAERREALLAGADVLLMGYRPGALARFGLGDQELSERHPHLVRVSLSAWGVDGPWASRRGFDSLVQVASGIAAECATRDGTPGVLPAQALDHATGHLMAATALRGLTRRSRAEQLPPARLSLASTAAALLEAPRPAEPATDATGRADLTSYRVAFGDVSLIAPPGTLDGKQLVWRHGPRPLGSDPPAWTE